MAADTAPEAVPAAVADVFAPLPPEAVQLGGSAGAAIARGVRARVAAQEVEDLIAPFRARADKTEWRSEFWGKWITSAIAAWRHTGDPQLRAALERAVRELIATQSADGYIGAYPDGGHLQRWDIWGRKYTLLGLLAWHEASGDAAALAAARREADFLLGEVGPGRASPFTNDMWSGMASSSVLEPMVLLYRRTGDRRYLAFAQFLVEQWQTPQGPDLLRKALAGEPVFAMFPGPAATIKAYGDAGKSKAYEMMSCYEGLAELYRTTGAAPLREAIVRVHAGVRDAEITIIGSGSDWERWNGGRTRQTEPWAKGMETCVTVTWMKFTAQLLRLTGDPAYAEALECSTYNALLGAQAPDGAWWCHHAPLAGTKERAPEQCGMHQNCCVANGPRGLMLLPQIAVMRAAGGPVVNFLGELCARVPLADGSVVTLEQHSDYPATDTTDLVVRVAAPARFALRVRIPAWSAATTLSLNGAPQPAPGAGNYLVLEREWRDGDRVALRWDMRGRLERAPGRPDFGAVLRGPLVLAQDARLTADGPAALRAPVTLAADASGHVALTLVTDRGPENIAQRYRLEGATSGGAAITLCDFASAGNTWSAASAYRVWLPLERQP